MMPEVALTSFTVRDAYRYFVGKASKSRSRREFDEEIESNWQTLIRFHNFLIIW